MQLINLQKAFTAPLKEKDALIKIGFFFLVNIILYAVYLAANFLPSLVTGSSRRGNLVGVLGAASLFVCCVDVVWYVVTMILQYWYKYQYMRAGITQQETKSILKTDFMVSMKQSLKLALVNFIYYIPVIIVVTCIVFAFYGFLFASIFSAIGTAASTTAKGTAASSAMAANFLSGFGVGIVILLCVLLIVGIAATLYQVFVVIPAELRLVESNTFANAFRMGENWAFVNKHSNEFFKLTMVIILIGFVYLFLVLVCAVLSIILIGIPLLIVLVLVAMYYQIFVFPYLIGDFYRNLKQIKTA